MILLSTYHVRTTDRKWQVQIFLGQAVNQFFSNHRQRLRDRAFGIQLILGAGVIALASITQSQAQSLFVDDAARIVTLPDKVYRVFAAGAPAEVLLYTLVPEKMVGRNHMPSQAALEFMPPEFRIPVQIMRLPNSRNANNDTELLALKPDLYIDYGDVTKDYIASVNNVQQRTGIPAIILNGGIEQIPATYRRLSTALGVEERGSELASEAERILTKYRGILLKSSTVPRVYIACSADAAIPCLEGERNGEMATLLSAINVAGTIKTAALRSLKVEDMQRLNPDVIIAASTESAARIRSDVAWQSIKAVAEHRVYVPPALPFNWGPRPPSVNRLMGLIWFAYVLPGKDFDAAFFDDVRQFFKIFYHVSITDEQLQRLIE